MSFTLHLTLEWNSIQLIVSDPIFHNIFSQFVSQILTVIDLKQKKNQDLLKISIRKKTR